MTDLSTLGPHLGVSWFTPLLTAIDQARPGAALEFGVALGNTLSILADAPHLDPVIGFDSFKGLPEDWQPGFAKGKFACKPPRIPGTELVIGWFADTLPALFNGPTLPGWAGDISLVHIDSDLYSSAATVLAHVGPHLTPGALVLFDQYHTWPAADANEGRAWREYVAATGTRFTPLGHGPQQALFRIED